MRRRAFIAPPSTRAFGSWGDHRPTWDVYIQPEWVGDDGAISHLAAACATEEAAKAALRLLRVGEEPAA